MDNHTQKYICLGKQTNQADLRAKEWIGHNKTIDEGTRAIQRAVNWISIEKSPWFTGQGRSSGNGPAGLLLWFMPSVESAWDCGKGFKTALFTYNGKIESWWKGENSSGLSRKIGWQMQSNRAGEPPDSFCGAMMFPVQEDKDMHRCETVGLRWEVGGWPHHLSPPILNNASFFKGKTIPWTLVVLGTGRIDDVTVFYFFPHALLPGEGLALGGKRTDRSEWSGVQAQVFIKFVHLILMLMDSDHNGHGTLFVAC
jgi:hypothetical protein